MLSFLKSEKYADRVGQIRTVTDKKQRDQLKATLPACTPSGLFSYRAEKNLIRHSRLLQFDIDQADNEELLKSVDLREALADLSYVAYVGLSVSGRGYWGLVPLAYPERHKEQFEALYLEFLSYGITLDTKPKNVASLRGYSYDEDAYFNNSAVAYEKCYREPKLPKSDILRNCHAPVDDPIGVAVRTLEKQGIIYTTGNRHNFLWQFARLCNRFGVSRQESEDYANSVYGYDEQTNWLDSYKRYAHESNSYNQRATAEVIDRTIQPSKTALCQPYHYGFLQTIVANGRSVTNEINEYGYPAFWDN